MARRPEQATLRTPPYGSPQSPASNGGPAFLSESEERIRRYNTVEREADAFGRIIGVRRLKPSEQAKLQGMTADLTGYDEGKDESGTVVQIPHRLPLFVAASVREITSLDGNTVHVAFPRSRAELDAVYDRLDKEGIEAAQRAFAKLIIDVPEDTAQAAKN